jgi:Flp pilus assembly CpaE family ATPase
LSQKWYSRIREITPSNAGQMPIPTLTFAQIEDFKGLENNHIAVIDIEQFAASPRDLALVYVAMSRARAGLWVAYRGDLAAEIQQAAAARMADVAKPAGKPR